MKTKKTLKSIIALALALILSLGVVSTAFAVNVGDTIEWTYEGDYGEYTGTDTYNYYGELTEGTNNIKGDDYEVPCYTFDAEKSGYYLFSSENGLYVNISEEIRDGAPYNYATGFYADGEECYSAGDDTELFYIPEGTTYTAVHFYGDYADGTLDIEYLGAELTDVNIDENNLKDLIKDYDFGYGSGNGFDLMTDVTFTFDNENEVVFENAYLRLDTLDSSEVVEGENTVKTINTFGIEKEYTLTCYPVDYYITKVEISNIDKYLTYKKSYSKYNYIDIGFYSANDGKGIEGETLTVTLCDGSTQSFVIDWGEEVKIELPNGRKVNLYVGENYRPYDDSLWFVAEVCGVIVFEKECTEIEATAKENFDVLKNRIENKISYIKFNVNFWMARISEAESIEEMAHYIRFMFNDISYYAKGILSEIGDCCEHLILS